MDRNNTSFPKYVYEYLKSLKYDPKSPLLYQQFIVSKYVLHNPEQRGLLIFHGLGRGKTRAASACVDLIREDYEKILIFAPKSTHEQHKNEYKDMSNIHTISIRANNLIHQIEKIGSLEHSIIIVDEAHNLFNSIVNGSENAVQLYDIIMSAKDIKLLFLTGTPIINEPFELVPCFNMLSGVQLFDEHKELFDKYFINKHGWFYNSDKFKSRIFGLTSYYGDWVANMEKSTLPKELPQKVIKLKMSEKQYAAYSTLRDKEIDMDSNKTKNFFTSNERFSKSKNSGSYRIDSRKASQKIPYEKDLTKKEHSIKFHHMLTIINNHKKQKGVIFSNLVSECGLKDIAEFLKINGWNEYEIDIDNDPIVGNGHTFALITGDQNIETRKLLQEAYNNDKNINGRYLRILLLGPAAAEGLDLKVGRWLINMTPYFQPIQGDQVKYRIIRHNSHIDLPEKDRNVQIYILLADDPKGKEETTDIFLHKLANHKRKNALLVMKALAESSMDCKLYNKMNCIMCAPTGDQLFDDNIHKDMKLKSKCKPLEYKSVDVKELVIEHDDKTIKFMYSGDKKNGFEFYQYSKDLKGYIPIGRSSKYFAQLYSKVS